MEENTEEMTTLKLNPKSNFELHATVTATDPYTDSVFLKFERFYREDSVHPCNHIFLSAEAVEELGMFLVEQAKIIKKKQA